MLSLQIAGLMIFKIVLRESALSAEHRAAHQVVYRYRVLLQTVGVPALIPLSPVRPTQQYREPSSILMRYRVRAAEMLPYSAPPRPYPRF